MKLIHWLFLFSVFTLTGCFDGASGGSSSLVALPAVYFQCDISQNNDCDPVSNPTLKVYVGWHGHASADCESVFLQLESLFIMDDVFSAWGTTTSFSPSSSVLIGEIGPTEWQSEGQDIGFLPNDTYTLCAFVDTDNNNRYSYPEPVGTLTGVSPQSQSLEITNWSN
ncbi:MAG: hypothetical protein H6626_03295 [Pseudobdellovibrionaceae bacterium]|nr:hypothetical protein [Bdellovibrionales bacterium]USN48127.1 MAG: hypothetical protein H6626_03295 [Pseudobdellovibrionaceae bacterium]